MFKRSMLTLALSTALLGCIDDGKDGQDGAQGPAGADGSNGANGQDGNSYPRNLSIEVVGRFATGTYGKSAAEIVQFHSASQSAFAINGDSNQIEVISLSGLPTTAVSHPTSDESLTSNAFTFPSQVAVALAEGNETINLGDVNSIAIYNDLLAIAVAAETKTDAGAILFYNLDNTGAGTFVKAVKVGSLPDMVAFDNSGTRALVANEGEPSKDFSVDPEGTISIIAIDNAVPANTASTVNFTTDLTFSNDLLEEEDYDTESERRQLLEDALVKFASPLGTTVAQDLEPEYITVSSDDKKAYVSLQENNALAIVDLDNLTVEVKGLGYKDWSNYQLDYTNKDEMPVFKSVDGLFGLYQPDSIDSFSWNGAEFIVSANEGDAREYIYEAASEEACTEAGHTYDDGDCIAYTEEYRIKDIADELSPELADLYEIHGGKNGLGRLKITNALGKVDTDGDDVADQFQKLYAYGARSFSIWDQNANLVFDSGDDFEKISASVLGNDFNSAHTENKGDNRSDDKGGEPEAITVGQIEDRTYAFIGLERSGDLFAYDVTNPFNVGFSAYYNNRDFTTSFELDDDLDNPCDENEGMDCSQVPNAGDLGPESIYFVNAETSPNGNPLLIIGNEVSGTVTVYQVTQQ